MAARRLAIVAAALALGVAAAAAAQSSAALVDRYAVLAGSRENARMLVRGLEQKFGNAR